MLHRASALATKADKLYYIKAVKSDYKAYYIKIIVINNNLQKQYLVVKVNRYTVIYNNYDYYYFSRGTYPKM